MRTLDEARAIAADALPRVKARRDYNADNEHAAARRKADLREIVLRILKARGRKCRKA